MTNPRTKPDGTRRAWWRLPGRTRRINRDADAVLMGASTPSDTTSHLVVLLPRDRYMMRTLTLPRAPRRELASMVRLTLESTLPPSFGEACIGLGACREQADGTQVVTCYAARASDVRDIHMRHALPPGRLCLVVPSHVIWQHLGQNAGEPGAWLVSEAGVHELVVRHASGTTHVRRVSRESGGNAGLPVEFVEAMASEARPGTTPRLRVVGDWHLRAAEAPQWLIDHADEERATTASGLATSLLREQIPWESVLAARMVPMDVQRREDVRTCVRHAGMAAGLLVASVACTALAFTLRTSRMEQHLRALQSAIASVEAEGEAAGARLAQDRAVQDAARSRRALLQGLAALHTVTGTGVTYTSIESRDAKVVEVRGRAPSVGIPFLLPQQLEQTGVLRSVLLLDASQKQQGDASVVEFRLQCTLTPTGPS